MSRYNPDHPESVHHGRYSFDDDVEIGPVRDVLEMSFEGGQEADVVLRFRVEIAQFGPMNFKVLDDDGIRFL